MPDYKNNNLKEVLTIIKNQQKLYFSGCHCSNSHLDATEKTINNILLKKIEDLIVEDIMNGGQHNIKNIGPDPRFPILAIDNMLFCNYQTAKKITLLPVLGCPLEGNYSSVNEGNKFLSMISDLQRGSITDFVKKYHLEGEYYNGTARLISTLEKLYNPDNFTDDRYSKTEFFGEIKFDNRAMLAAMQFINANTNNSARYENSSLYFADTQIKAVGAYLKLKRSSTSEKFMLSGITLKLYANEKTGIYAPFDIAVGENVREAARSFGYMFTDTTYPKYADKADDKTPIAVLKIPAWKIHQNACGGPDDKRTLKQFFEDYEKVDKATSGISFALKILNRTADDDEMELALVNRDYCCFIEKWRNALDFVQCTALPYEFLEKKTIPSKKPTIKLLSGGYKIASFFDKKKYIEYLAQLSGGLNSYVFEMLRKKADYSEVLDANAEEVMEFLPKEKWITYEKLEKASRYAMNCYADELNRQCRYTDIFNSLTISELEGIISEIEATAEKIFRETAITAKEYHFDIKDYSFIKKSYFCIDYAWIDKNFHRL